MVSCILLSAGLSSRFGSPKALALIDGQHIIAHTLETLLNTQISEIIVVLGHEAKAIEPYILNHKKIKVVYNKDYNFGQTSSFQVGLNNLSAQTDGIMLLPVDYPFVKQQTFDEIVQSFTQGKSKICIPVFEGKKGHPPVFDINLKNEFLGLDKDCGINSIANQNQDEISCLEVFDAGVVKSFNTYKEFKDIAE